MALSVEPVDQGPQLDISMRVIREGRGRHNHVGPIVYSTLPPVDVWSTSQCSRDLFSEL